MAKYFVDTFLLKKQRIKNIIKISIATIIAFFVLLIFSKITSLFILNSAVKETIEKFKSTENNQIELTIEKSFLKSELKIKDMHISVNTGEIDITELIIKKESGFIIPSLISLVPKGITSSPANSQKKYDIVNKGGEYKILIKLNRFLTKKPTFGGVKIEKPTNFVFLENNNNIGDFNLEILDIIVSDFGTYTNYKGNMVFHDGDFIPSVIVLDKPFKWEVKFFETKKTQKSKLYSSKDEEVVNNLNIEKMIFDFDFSKVEISGKSIYGNQLYSTDLKANITNDGKFIDAVFNMIMQSRDGDTKTFKQIHKILKNEIVPKLKKNSDSTKDTLDLTFKKLENDNDISINGVITMTELVNKLAGV